MRGNNRMERKINTIILCAISNPWLETLEILRDNLGINPVYYIGWRKDLTKKRLNEHFPDCYYQTIQDAWKGIGFPENNYCKIDEEILNSVAKEEIIFLKMLDRLDVDRYSFNLTYRSYFFHDLLSTWLNIIDEKKIELIISPSVPHRGFDYALYVASKIRKIEFIMFQMTPFNDSSFILDNVTQTPDYIKRNILKRDNNTVLCKDIEEKIENIMQSYNKAIPDYMVNQKNKSEQYNFYFDLLKTAAYLLYNGPKILEKSFSYHVQKNKMPSKSKITVYQNAINVIKGRKYKINLENFYLSLCDDTIPERYVLVALHYQPEETSCPTGGRYADQTLIVRLLHNFLKDDIDIVIKEHKTQFFPFGEGEVGRDKYFYERLRSISPRVKFVSFDENPFNLIDGALATVTISGTIGWESVIRGTPAIIFGRAWYEDMPGVFKIKTYEELVRAWPKIVNCKNKMNHDLILNYHKILQGYFINALHYKSYISRSNRTFNESSDNLYLGIRNHLVQKGWVFDD